MSAEGTTRGLRQSKCLVLEFTFSFLCSSCDLGSGYSTCFTWDPRVTLCGWQDFKIQEPKLCVASIFCLYFLFSVGQSGVILQELGCITDIFFRFFVCFLFGFLSFPPFFWVGDLFVLRDKGIMCWGSDRRKKIMGGAVWKQYKWRVVWEWCKSVRILESKVVPCNYIYAHWLSLLGF